MARKFTYNEKQSGDSTQAKKGKVFHCTADNLRPAIIVIREVKNHISNEPSVHFNLANMLGRQKIEFVVRDSLRNFTTIRQRRRWRRLRDGPLEKLWVGGVGCWWGIFELQEFFREIWFSEKSVCNYLARAISFFENWGVICSDPVTWDLTCFVLIE